MLRALGFFEEGCPNIKKMSSSMGLVYGPKTVVVVVVVVVVVGVGVELVGVVVVVVFAI